VTLRRVLILSIFLLLGYHAPEGQAQGAGSLWRTLISGVEYREFYLYHPNHLYVARMARGEPGLTLESGISQGALTSGSETVSGMFHRYDQAINYWGENWGGRNQVVVGINGYFFDPDTGVPSRGQIQSGWYIKRFDDFQNGSGFVWTLNGDAFIGGCVTHPEAKQVIRFPSNGETLTFTGINIPRGEDDLILYTSHYGTQTGTDQEGIEVLVELSRPLMILPEPAKISGSVVSVHDGDGNSLIPFDQIVLSASGDKATELRRIAAQGDEIGISQEIKHFASNCSSPKEPGWEKTYSSIGASFEFLRDGVLQGFDDLGAVFRSPRTAIAYNDQFIYFIVVDGRDRFISAGLSVVELGVFAKTQLGVVWGAALDGGGSSTMVVNGAVVNNPNAELEDGSAGAVERVVGNGLMMVAVQPMEISSQFQQSDRVRAGKDLEVRLGPGTNYASFAVVLANTEGFILENTNGMNGILAKGSYWWKVSFGDVVGWVVEEALTPQ